MNLEPKRHSSKYSNNLSATKFRNFVVFMAVSLVAIIMVAIAGPSWGSAYGQTVPATTTAEAATPTPSTTSVPTLTTVPATTTTAPATTTATTVVPVTTVATTTSGGGAGTPTATTATTESGNSGNPTPTVSIPNLPKTGQSSSATDNNYLQLLLVTLLVMFFVSLCVVLGLRRYNQNKRS